jgi:trk system potassium uptake protein TrkA
VKVVVIGGGEIGKAIADAMVKENNEVYIVEDDEFTSNTLMSSMDVQVIQGSGCHPAALRSAHIGEADLVAVVTDRDEDNLCASMLARHFAPNAKIIARIRNPDLASETDFLVRSGPKLTHILNPEILAAKQIFHAIKIPSAVEVMDFEDGKLFLIGVKIPGRSLLVGRTMKELPGIIQNRSILFVARYRNDALIIPKGNSDVQADDLLYFISKAEDIRPTAAAIGLEWTDVRSVVVAGATVTGIQLVRYLKESGVSVKLIEKNHALATAATEALPDVLVLEAEPTDGALWEEENLAGCDALVSVCKDEQLNLMVALLGRKMGIKHTAVITYRSTFIPILLESGITTVVSPRSAAISMVLKFLRKGRILQVSSTEHEDAELLEYETKPGDKITGKMIRDMGFPKGAIIAAIFRDNGISIPSGSTEIAGGDKILIFARNKVVPEVEKLMLTDQG